VAVAARTHPLPAPEPEYRQILVPLGEDGWAEALTAACRLADEHGATITALVTIVIPASLPMNAHMLDDEARARRLLGEAEAIADLHGVSLSRCTIRAREAGAAVVTEAERLQSDLIVLRAARRTPLRNHGPIFGKSVSFVLQHAPCRVIVSTAPAR
jgi:basic amino acid/polyamine antiporter, APA family